MSVTCVQSGVFESHSAEGGRKSDSRPLDSESKAFLSTRTADPWGEKGSIDRASIDMSFLMYGVRVSRPASVAGGVAALALFSARPAGEAARLFLPILSMVT
jgi:hypothetical protein